MTTFQAFAFGLLTIVFGPSLTWACESVLKSSPRQLPSESLILPRSAGYVKKLAENALMFAVPEGGGNAWTIIFDADDDHKNEGFLVSGTMRRGVFKANMVRRSSLDDEKEYFKAVAQMHTLPSQTLHVQREHARCQDFEVSGWVETKLLIKHDLRLKEVAELLENAETERVFEKNGYRDRRYRVKAYDKRGRAILIVIAEKEDCPNILVTAYAESERHH